jgi:uncharacterized protein
MQCPVCTDKTLVMSERQGIEIDYCPGCRGVWLDRGELDKILERSVREAAAEAPAAPPRPVPSAPAPTAYSPPPPAYAPTPGYHDHGYKHHKRKKSFLEDLFD